MDLSDSPEQARYRETVRAWLAEHRDEAPAPSGSNEDGAYVAARRRWQGALAEGGLAGVTWPAEYGGRGLGPIEHVIVNQEISAAGVPGILDTIGVGMLGPTLIGHGTDAQKAARCCTATRSGASCSRSQPPDRTSPGSRPARGARRTARGA
jgi:alkylation response protein AidB-like acyl-CoA dehydrogenase